MDGDVSLPAGSVHCIGIAGYGVRGLARLLVSEGRRVTGSDLRESAILDELRGEGIVCAGSQAAGNVPPDATLVVHSAAIPGDNPELAEARARGIPCCKYAVALGRFCASRDVLACAGTHGKSTTTAMLAWLLRRAGLEAGYLVGADPAPGMAELRTNACDGDPMVLEACEYDRSFLNLAPRGAVVTNVEREHVDCFPTEEELFAAFRAFIGRIRPGGVIVVPPELVERLEIGGAGLPCRVVTFGPRGSYRLADVTADRGVAAVTIVAPGGERIVARLRLAGFHNALNVTGAVALAAELYGPGTVATAAFEAVAFMGLRRRAEVLCRGPIAVIDDYAHHPTEIEATLGAVAELLPAARRRIVVFQPHQRKRLEALRPGFVRALASADRVFVTPVFAAREEGRENVQASAALVEELRGVGVAASSCPDLAAARAAVLICAEPGDAIVCLGAGDVTDLAGELSRAVARPEVVRAQKSYQL
jgi:UDP-N-acetylmuramate--alanine ligase